MPLALDSDGAGGRGGRRICDLDGDPAAAASVFQQIGGGPTPVPWAYLPGDFAENFRTAHDGVLTLRPRPST
ncbi:hypothetical protein GCM10010530_60920 [Kribbella aluminosa]